MDFIESAIVVILTLNNFDGRRLLMNLIFSLDENYVPPLKVLLYSIFEKTKEEQISVYLLHDEIPTIFLNEIEELVTYYGHIFHPVSCLNKFQNQENWTTSRYYSVEMYYWLLAPFLLPQSVKKGLYLDPDIICLNDFSEWYHEPMEEYFYKASSHNYVTKFTQPFNKVRLQTYSSDGYYNSGVVLMDFEKIRENSSMEEIQQAIIENKNRLILPDQDIFNLLYFDRIKEEDWRVFNLSPGIFDIMATIFPKDYNLEKTREEAIFVHYMGKSKPWDEREEYRYQLGEFYFETEKQAKMKFPQLFKNTNMQEDL